MTVDLPEQGEHLKDSERDERGRHKTNVRNTNIGKQSETKDYKLARLKRDNPEIYEEVLEGKISANAGSQKAGCGMIRSNQYARLDSELLGNEQKERMYRILDGLPRNNL